MSRYYSVCRTCARLAKNQVFITMFSMASTCAACGGPRGKNGEIASPKQFTEIQTKLKKGK